MNPWHRLLHDLKNRLQRKHTFTMDADAYETLRLVAQREKRSPQEMASRLFEQAAYEQESRVQVVRSWEQLSPRQKQIAAHICRGDSTGQIAAELNIAQTTVKSHVEVILLKFDVNSRVALRDVLSPWDLTRYL